MVDRIIDLRSKAQPAEWEEAKKLPVPAATGPLVIRWSGREHEKRERSHEWYLALGGLAVLLILFGVWTGNYFFIAFVGLGFLTFVMYERRPSPELEFVIFSDGVQVGKTHHRFSELKSFWIFEDLEGKELSLETTKTIMPFLRLPLKNVDVERVKMFLRNYLPEQEHKEFISDQIAKNL